MKEFTLPYSKKVGTLNSTPLSGGGNSDITTAKVTIVNEAQEEVEINIPYIYEGQSPETKASVSTPSCSRIQLWVDGESSKTVDVILYKGLYTYEFDATSLFSLLNSSGDVEFDFETQTISIFGDCTLNIAGVIV